MNGTLKVALKLQTVEVDASVPLLQTEGSAVAQVVENASITSLPLIDRRSAQLHGRNGFVVQNSSRNAARCLAAEEFSHSRKHEPAAGC